MLSRYSVSQMFQADMVVMTHVEVFVIYWEDPGGGLGRPLHTKLALFLAVL